MKTLVWVMLLLGCLEEAQAQGPVLTGLVTDSLSGRPLEKAVVSMVEKGSRGTRLRVMTDTSGNYNIYKAPGGDYLVVVSFIGYRTKAFPFRAGRTGDLGIMSLVPSVREMQDVVIEAPAIHLKVDTVEYQSDAFPVRKDATLEDLLKKLPGFQVDKDGNITAYGQKPVTKIRIGGKDFFLGDPRVASQNIPADVIDKIQVIDDKSDQAKLTGFDDGERQQVVNITVKRARTDPYFGKRDGRRDRRALLPGCRRAGVPFRPGSTAGAHRGGEQYQRF